MNIPPANDSLELVRLCSLWLHACRERVANLPPRFVTFVVGELEKELKSRKEVLQEKLLVVETACHEANRLLTYLEEEPQRTEGMRLGVVVSSFASSTRSRSCLSSSSTNFS